MKTLQESLQFIEAFKADHPSANKSAVQRAWAEWASPEKARSVYVADGFSIRFSEAMTGGFSNTVLSLSALAKHDTLPFIVAVVRKSSVNFLLANATFLKKISHSAQELRVDNVKGSFNGSDIMTVYEGVTNTPENFDELFSLHSAFTWEDNLERLVEKTNSIVTRNIRFQPSDAEKELILNAPVRFADAINSESYMSVEQKLIAQIDLKKSEILAASKIDNVNIRGNVIEQLITGGRNAHELGDLVESLDGRKLVIDIKTKLLDRASSPKAYNVDKMLRLLAQPTSIFAFFMVGVNMSQGEVTGRLLTVLDDALRKYTVVQHHWAGRGSRGVTQFTGRFGQAFSSNYCPKIDIESSQNFLVDLIGV